MNAYKSSRPCLKSKSDECSSRISSLKIIRPQINSNSLINDNFKNKNSLKSNNSFKSNPNIKKINNNRMSEISSTNKVLSNILDNKKKYNIYSSSQLKQLSEKKNIIEKQNKIEKMNTE